VSFAGTSAPNGGLPAGQRLGDLVSADNLIGSLLEDRSPERLREG
jgi:hypothetical protein